MRKRLIKQLDYKERQWFLKAVVKMIIADKSVSREEVEELKESLMLVVGKELKDFGDVVTSPEFLTQLNPFNNIPYDHAYIMMTELCRIAAIDSKVVLEEEGLIKEILSLLGFNEAALEKVIPWTKRLALANQEEDQLKEELQVLFRS